MSKLPSFQFYPGDWLRDGVSGCSLEAQGLWLRMLIVMHDSDTYGYLVINGSPMDSAMVARRCGCSLKQYEAVVTELDEAGILSRTKAGIIYSRRMVRDAEERAANAERQRKFKAKNSGNGEGNGKVTPRSQKSNTSSSSSSSPSPSGKKKDNSPERELSKKEPENRSLSPPSELLRLPDNFELTDEMRLWTSGRGISVNLDFETEKFKNYYGSRFDEKAYSQDWLASWKNWILRGQEYADKTEENNGNGKKPTNADIYASYGYDN